MVVVGGATGSFAATIVEWVGWMSVSFSVNLRGMAHLVATEAKNRSIHGAKVVGQWGGAVQAAARVNPSIG